MPAVEEACVGNMNNNIKKAVLFWDWDDTLLCSSALSEKGYRLSTDMKKQNDTELETQLKVLEASVAEVLRTSLEYGEVHVVTNAENRWVELSAKKWLPSVVPLLEQCHIFSARSTFENQFPKDPQMWKNKAFEGQLGKVLWKNETEKQIFSFGDSEVERRALMNVTSSIANAQTKSVKFQLKPTVEQLRVQQGVVRDALVNLLKHNGNLDLCTVEDRLAPFSEQLLAVLDKDREGKKEKKKSKKSKRKSKACDNDKENGEEENASNNNINIDNIENINNISINNNNNNNNNDNTGINDINHGFMNDNGKVVTE